MVFCRFFIILSVAHLLLHPPLSATTLHYHPGKAHDLTVQYHFDVEQQLANRPFTSHVDGALNGRITALSDRNGEKEAEGVPDRVTIWIDHWNGHCIVGDQQTNYSSSSPSSLNSDSKTTTTTQSRTIPSPYERAANIIAGKSLTFRIERPIQGPNRIAVAPSPELTALYVQHPVLKEMLPEDLFESILQQVFATSGVELDEGKSIESGLSLMRGVEAPAQFKVVETSPTTTVAEIDADLQMARGNLYESIKGRFYGKGEWNSSDLLNFHTEINTDYTMTFPATGNSSSDVRVHGNWTIKGQS